MRRLLLAIIFAIGGCSQFAGPGDLRMPSTPGEWAEVEALNQSLLPPLNRMADAWPGICGSPPCVLRVRSSTSDRLGAFSDATTTYFSTGMLKFLRNDDERAMLVGHEWAHILLGHHGPRISLSRRQKETEADCVGTMLAAGAGFDPKVGRELWRRMAGTTDGVLQNVLWGSGDYPPIMGRYRTIGEVAAALHGRRVTRPVIREICGVAP